MENIFDMGYILYNYYVISLHQKYSSNYLHFCCECMNLLYMVYFQYYNCCLELLNSFFFTWIRYALLNFKRRWQHRFLYQIFIAKLNSLTWYTFKYILKMQILGVVVSVIVSLIGFLHHFSHIGLINGTCWGPLSKCLSSSYWFRIQMLCRMHAVITASCTRPGKPQKSCVYRLSPLHTSCSTTEWFFSYSYNHLNVY